MRGRVKVGESRSTARGLLGVVGLSALVALAPSCAPPLDTERQLPKRGSVGQEMYTVLCDRVAAQALREDLTGGSFRDVCHANAAGEFEDKVDTAKLPPLDPAGRNAAGTVVDIETQRDVRERAVGRIEALARRRKDLVRAFDTIFPDSQRLGVKDLDNEDPRKSCGAAKKSEAKLTTALADMLGRMTELYHDGTLPNSTQSLGRVVDAFKNDDEAQAAWARIASREGYRPVETALGVARPAIAYPNLRDLSNASLRLLSADSLPYQLDPKRDESGRRIPVPGPGNAALNAMLAAAHEELLDAKRDPKPGPLAVTADASSGRVVLSRPRDNLEVMQELLYKTDPAFSVGSPHWIVRRDARGYAAISGGLVPTPFVDANKDGLPDVDDRGRFVTVDKSLAPSPFPYPNGPETTRDEFGRALAGSRLLYDYIDTSSTFAAQITKDLRPLADPDPQKEALMGVLGGAYVAMGPKGPATKAYARTTLEYDGFKADTSPMLDLVYAATTLLGDRNMDATLAMARELVANHPKELARFVGGLLAAQEAAKPHDEAKIPKNATFWDEILDASVQLAKEPGLLEDVLRAMAAPESEGLGGAFGSFAKFQDEVRYDYDDFNGPTFNITKGGKRELETPVDRTQPQVGKNRSALYRFLGAISDSMGVAACNRADAIVHARGVPIFGEADICSGTTVPKGIYGGCGIGARPFRECELFKIDDLGTFYLDSIAGEPTRGALYIRDAFVREGIGGIGAANAETMEKSSGIVGFWGTDLRPKPQWLNRLVFFDHPGDTKNEIPKRFLADMNGLTYGSSLCPERIIDDPVPGAPDAAPDKKVHGLRNCPEGYWLNQRQRYTLFTLENFGFYQAMRPLAAAFAVHKREDIFLRIASTIYKHYPGEESTSAECVVAGNKPCPKTGALAYEGAVADALATDVIGGLGELSRVLDKMALKRCEEADAKGACTKTTTVSGIDVAAAAARAALDPDYARSTLKLVDRRGEVTAKRNDGTTNPQVTPIYLVTSALSAIDEAFDKYEADTGDKERRASWRRSRSLLVDQFLGVDGARATAVFRNPTVSKMGPTLVDVLRSQLVAHCPKSFNAPFERCAWARDELPKKAGESLAGPLASGGLEMMEAIRKDPVGRQEMAKMVQYLADAASSNDALASMLASMNDVVQMLRDDDNLVPFYRVIAAAMDASKKDAQGRVTEPSLVDAQMALLARVSGRAFDADLKEICSKEVDPNQVLSKVLANAVTPIKDGDFKGQTPVEVILDVIADVNRRDPREAYEGTLAREDYANVSQQVFEFLMDKQRGLEQFYEVVRQGTTF